MRVIRLEFLCKVLYNFQSSGVWYITCEESARGQQASLIHRFKDRREFFCRCFGSSEARITYIREIYSCDTEPAANSPVWFEKFTVLTT